jgi:hypothetical protein
MSTKLNAVELAEQRYPNHLEPDAMIGVRPFQLTRLAFKCAVEEVAQPIADERDELRAFAERSIKIMGRTANDTLDGRNAAVDGRELLAKYPKP